MKKTKEYINLLPKEEKKKKLVRIGVGAVLVLLFVSAWAGALGWQWKQVWVLENRAAVIAWTRQARVQELGAIQKELGITAAPSMNQEKTGLINSLLSERVSWSQVFQQFSRIVPKGLWFDSLEGSAGTGKAEIKIKGGAFNYLSVADFMQGLEKSGYFHTPQLVYAQKIAVQSQDVIGFEISCGIKKAPGAQ